MLRKKTELEKSETPKQEAQRLREALFIISNLDDFPSATHANRSLRFERLDAMAPQSR